MDCSFDLESKITVKFDIIWWTVVDGDALSRGQNRKAFDTSF